MEKIFKNFRVEVDNNGFSQQIMSRILSANEAPSSNTYRIPTIWASVCTAILIVITTISVGLGTMNDKYEQIVASMQSYTYEKYAEKDLAQDCEFENLEFQQFDKQ